MNKKPPVIVIAGPTGTGKTKLSVSLASMLDAEIISCDSMQIYKGMDIGTAKVTSEEAQGIPHHMIDIKNPDEQYSVSDFVTDAAKCAADIHSRGKTVILVGGTGLYADSFIKGINFTEDSGANPAIRSELEAFCAANGKDALHRELELIDPESAAAIHPNNTKRVIRAIEYFRQSGETISEHNRRTRQKPSAYDYVYIGLTRDREELYARIDQRVDLMMAQGLEDEVFALYRSGITRRCTSMQALGYKELLYYIGGRCTIAEAVRIIKRDSRRYAKRQLTWFGRNKEMNWINLTGISDVEALNRAREIISERGLIL